MSEKHTHQIDSQHDHAHGDHHHHDHDHDHEHDAAPKASQRDKRYWNSLEQWSEDPEFQKMAEKEFQSSPLSEGPQEDGWARREFLKLMGASMAMATAGCIRRPVQKIVPYNKQPEEVTFKVANYYTTSYFDGSEAQALLVKTVEGRPLKIEGNPNHPLTAGGTSVRSQAHILSLYDPDRLQGPRKNLLNKTKSNFETINANWEALDEEAVKQLSKGGVVVLSGAINSPATRAVVGDFLQAFGGKHVVWEPLANEEVRLGQKASYGEDVVPFYQFEKAKMIVSIDADFLGTWLQPTAFSHGFTKTRIDIKNMSKLVVFDSNYSLTGANADIRVRIKPSQQVAVVMGLLHEIVVKKGQGNQGWKPALEPFANVAADLAMEPALFSRIAEDLLKNRGESIVVAGGLATLTEQSQALQLAVNALNSTLGNDGTTVLSKSGLAGLTASYEALATLKKDLDAGRVKTVIIHKTNPLYALPSSFGFAESLKKAEMVYYTGDRIDETARVANYVIPDNHTLENWGDAEIGKGLFTVSQPTIRPMYDTRSFQLTLMTWAYLAEKGPQRLRDYETFHDYLRAFWRQEIYPKAGSGQGFDAFWNDALQAGVVGKLASSSSRSFSGSLAGAKNVKSEGYELVLYPTVALGDGTYANIAWLQELPDPVTKICWDNYVSISIATAEKLKAKEGTMLEITVNGKSYKLPAHIQPGLHDDVLAVAVGYGRTHAGKVGNNIGLNAFEMMTVSANGAVVASGLKAEVKNTGVQYVLANPQGGHTLDGRQIVLEATLKQYLKDPSAGQHKHHVFSFWSGHQYNGHKWGMAVDLNTCTGCNACVIACQSENNIPVVGKKYVIQGREMHWLRIDRYYVGEPKDAEVVFQPLMCQHCDNAPCESVCPVAATVHSDEGLNDMVYNRCVGTRYCANNCPYKVRRFNWFNYARKIDKPMHLALNPDVLVRQRGVMEKCTFCVHRIKEGKQKARLENRELKDGDIKVACQQSCPTGGIVFGDLNDENSKVSKMAREQRAYTLLAEFNAKPNVHYLAKIRNNDQESRGGLGAHGEGGH